MAYEPDNLDAYNHFDNITIRRLKSPKSKAQTVCFKSPIPLAQIKLHFNILGN